MALAAMGMTTVLACRNLEKATAAASEVRERAANGAVHVVALDLSDLASVTTCAEHVLERWDRLDVLVNNAGGIWSKREESVQGFEQTFAVNHLGHFALTLRFLDRLEASAPSRIVNLTSVIHHGAVLGMRWDDLDAATPLHLGRRLCPVQVGQHPLHPGAGHTARRYRRHGQCRPSRPGPERLRDGRRLAWHRVDGQPAVPALRDLPAGGRHHQHPRGHRTRARAGLGWLLRPGQARPDVPGAPARCPMPIGCGGSASSGSPERASRFPNPAGQARGTE